MVEIGGMETEKYVTPEWLLANGFEEFFLSDLEDEYPGLPVMQECDNRFFREKEFNRNLFVIKIYPYQTTDYHEYFDYEVYIQEDVGCPFVRMPFLWSGLPVDRLNDLYSSFMGKRLS